MDSQRSKQSPRVAAEIIRRSLQLSAWLLVALIVAFTLSPIELRPVSGAPANLERIVAFAALGAVFVLAYPHKRLAAFVFLVSFAATLETLQNFVPGRHGRSEDFVVKAVAVVAGFLLAHSIMRIVRVSWFKPQL